MCFFISLTSLYGALFTHSLASQGPEMFVVIRQYQLVFVATVSVKLKKSVHESFFMIPFQSLIMKISNPSKICLRSKTELNKIELNIFVFNI